MAALQRRDHEGRNRTGEEFGLERLHASLGLGGAADVLARSWAAWETFVDRDHQHDDACLALILTKPPASLEITSCASDCKRARRFIEDWALAAGYGDLERGRIVLAADEATTNIIRHTYHSAPDRPIFLSAAIQDGHLHLRLRDYGPAVNVTELKGRALEDVRPGGLGLHLLSTVFDVVEHAVLADGMSGTWPSRSLIRRCLPKELGGSRRPPGDGVFFGAYAKLGDYLSARFQSAATGNIPLRRPEVDGYLLPYPLRLAGSLLFRARKSPAASSLGGARSASYPWSGYTFNALTGFSAPMLLGHTLLHRIIIPP